MKKLVPLTFKIMGCPLWVEVDGEDDVEINYKASRVDNELANLLDTFYTTRRKND